MRKGQRDFLRWKACDRKTAYESEAAAFQKGQRAYHCRYCGKWHRTSGIIQLVNVVRRGGIK